MLDRALLCAVTVIGGLLRFVRLSYPKAYVFDEVYYAKDACLYLAKGMKFCGTPSNAEQSYVHPPLAKWIIAVGEWLWGYNSFGWRIMAAVFGTAMIVVVFLLARKLLGRWAATMAALFVAGDFLLIVESRIAMQDIFISFFVMLGFYFVVCDHQQVLRLREAGVGKLDIRWRVAAGLAFGCAGACKWSGFYALAGAGVLLLVWHVGTALKIRRAESTTGLPHRAPSPVAELNATLLSVGIPVVAVYLASYAVYFKENHWSLSAFLTRQNQMLSFNLTLNAHHPYASRPWSWPFIIRPVAYYFQSRPPGCTITTCIYNHILAFGNPWTWYAALPAFLVIAILAWGRPHGPERIIMVGWLFQYLPWFLAERTSFFYYMTPIVPFMMLALAAALYYFARGSKLRTCLVIGYLVVGVATVWFWYPVVTGLSLPEHTWTWRMLYNSWI